jgi:hypothetical protein
MKRFLLVPVYQTDRADCLGLLRSPAGINPLTTGFCVLAGCRAGIENGVGFFVSASHSSGSKLPRHGCVAFRGGDPAS